MPVIGMWRRLKHPLWDHENNMEPTKQSGKTWMWGIVISILTFMAFFVGFAIWTSFGDVELVYDNYYAKDVVFEQQIRRVERTDALEIKPRIVYDQSSQFLTLKFSPEMGHRQPVGEILLFRPSDLHKDRLFTLDLSGDSLQTIRVQDLDPGLWRIKLDWKSGDKEYYLEQMLTVRGKQ